MFAYHHRDHGPQQISSWSSLIEGYLAELAAAGRPASGFDGSVNICLG